MEKNGPVWHEETIDERVARTLIELRGCSVLSSFYLAGGTGLALRLGHRRSVDLDFFAREAFDENAILPKIQRLSEFSVVAKSPGTLHVQINGTKVSFLAFDYPTLFPCGEFHGVQVADPRDIACMKLSAIAGRGTKRDFIDLYAVALEHGLSQIMEWFNTKFAAANYSRVHLLKSLTYFVDAEKDPAPDLLVPISWEQVKQFFSTEVPQLL